MVSDQSIPMARLEARVPQGVKELIQKAADLQGRTLTDFVTAIVEAEATRVIEQYHVLKLNLEDSEAFVEALLNPPEPNAALKKAAQRYKQRLAE
jgi:uncharacterized protein (DUF1778 family)